MKLIFATANAHKMEEVMAVIPSTFELLSLKDLEFNYDIPETGDTLEENALIKARFIHQKYGTNVFSEDTGLEVHALGGLPGVITARYAGVQRNHIDNMDKVLMELKDKDDRSAQFRAVIALILNNTEYLFEGILKGRIGFEKNGSQGFGYDPIFIPEGYDKTAAELGSAIKNTISHRVRALNKMVNFLDAAS